jgi:hypothetical protein
MSHFTVTVCLPAGTDPDKLDELLADVMERWNEGRRVESFRDYEEGPASEYWWASSCRRIALDYEKGEGIKPYDPDQIGWSSASSKQTPEEQREEQRKDHEWAVRLGVDPANDGKAEVTWAKVAELFNECYGHGSALALPGDDSDSETLYYDAEEGRAYTVSTRNPESMWDFWVIGGRWRGKFHGRQGVGASALVIAPVHWSEQYSDTPYDPIAPNNGLRCDGGPKWLLDLESVRQQAAREAGELFDKYLRCIDGTPHADPWSHFCYLAKLGEITWDEARSQYHEQPRIKAIGANEDLKWHDDPITKFMSGRDEYVAQERVAAVPGYALVTLDREWMAPGRMGWWGMSSDGPGEKHAYKVEANRYLDSLPDNAVIVQLDCHI